MNLRRVGPKLQDEKHYERPQDLREAFLYDGRLSDVEHRCVFDDFWTPFHLDRYQTKVSELPRRGIQSCLAVESQ